MSDYKLYPYHSQEISTKNTACGNRYTLYFLLRSNQVHLNHKNHPYCNNPCHRDLLYTPTLLVHNHHINDYTPIIRYLLHIILVHNISKIYRIHSQHHYSARPGELLLSDAAHTEENSSHYCHEALQQEVLLKLH